VTTGSSAGSNASRKEEPVKYCEAHVPPYVRGDKVLHQVFCGQRAVHVIVIDSLAEAAWTGGQYVRYVCDPHADYYCDRGWGIPARNNSNRKEE